MLELKKKSFVDDGEDYGGPPITYFQVGWIPADPLTTRTEEFYLFNEYEGGSDTTLNPSCALGELNLRLVPMNDAAQSILDQGAIEIRHDFMVAPSGSWSASYDADGSSHYEPAAYRIDTYYDWYTPTGSIPVGALPLGSTTDTSQMCRFEIRVTNLATPDIIGPSYFLLTVETATVGSDFPRDSYVYDVPVYDCCVYDGGGETADYAKNYLDSGIAIEIVLMDRDLQEVYEDFGFQFWENV